jgi:hypothetical protein
VKYYTILGFSDGRIVAVFYVGEYVLCVGVYTKSKSSELFPLEKSLPKWLGVPKITSNVTLLLIFNL